MEFKYVIIGGGLAAGRAADGIRRVDKSGSVVIVCNETFLPYERPPLSKAYLRGEADRSKLFYKDDAFYDENNITVLAGIRATDISPQSRMVALEDGRTIHYQKLLLATGGRAWRLPIPGADLPNVFTLRSVADSDSIRAAALPGVRALVIGGSFIGSEVAASLTQLGAKVTMVFLEKRLQERVLPPEVSKWLRARFEAEGVRLVPDATVGSLEGGAAVERAVLSTGETLDVDIVVMGVGIRLNTTLARDAGLQLTEQSAVVVDEQLRTSDPNIYAAGDIAAWPDKTFGKRLRVEHWDVARMQGFRAGRNMAGESRPYDTLPYFFSDLFDLSFEVWGDLSEWDRVAYRGDPVSGHVAIYYFRDGLLCGVLAMGRPDAERKPMQALVVARPVYDDVATQLADESVKLESLIAG